MLNILFWNLKRNSIEKLIVECLVENNIDIAIFIEYNAIDLIEIEKNLGKMYVYVEGVQKDTKIVIIAKTTLEVTIIQQQNRYSLCQVKMQYKSIFWREFILRIDVIIKQQIELIIR